MTARIIGTGRARPEHAYDNAFMATFVGAPPPWSADVIERKLGISERRFSVQLGGNTGLPVTIPDEVDLARDAATRALAAADRSAHDVDLLIYVSCTVQKGVRRHFSRGAFDLHLRLGLPKHARVQEMDAGCGGALHAMEIAWEAILSGRRKTVLVVASSCPSGYMNRDFYARTESWLSALIFGDGAGAIVLERGKNGTGIIETVTSVDPAVPLMTLRGDPAKDPELAYWIDARRVREAFGLYAYSALEALKAKAPQAAEADAFIFHQVNAKVLSNFVDQIGLPHEKVPIHVDRRGNIAAAATLDILDEEIEEGHLGRGARIVICAVGAGAQAGAMLLTL